MKPKNIGILIQRPTGAGGFFDDAFKAIRECIAKRNEAGFFIFNGGHISFATAYMAVYNKIYSLVSDRFLDGIIVDYTIGNSIPQKKFREFCLGFGNVPVITILGTLQGMPSVCLDNRTGMRELMSHLTGRMGYTKLGFIKGVKGNPDAEQRFDVFNEVLLELGLLEEAYDTDQDYAQVFQGNFTEAAGTGAAEHFLPMIRSGEIEAIVAANDAMAIGTIDALRRHSVYVPDDVAVTGFDNASGGKSNVPALTTVNQPINEIIDRAVDWLLANCPPGKDGPGGVPAFSVESRLVVRQSCGNLPDPVLANGRRGESGPLGEIFGDRYEQDAAMELRRTLKRHMEDEKDTTFFRKVRRMLYRDMDRGKDISAWYGIIVKLLFSVKTTQGARDDVAERILQNILNLINSVRMEEFERSKIDEKKKSDLFLENFNNLSASFKVESLESVFLNNFKSLGIESTYIFVSRKDENAKTYHELLLGYDDGKVLSEVGNDTGEKKRLVYDVLPTDRPCKYTLHPLQYEGIYLGYSAIELNRSELGGATYDRLQKVFSTALQGYLMMERETQALTIISNIQKKLLPEIAPALYGDFEISALTLPLTPGGGDLFNVYRSGDTLTISIGDVEGHGIRAGIIMMLTLYTYQMLVKEEEPLSPKSFLEKLNTRIYEIIATNLELFSYVTFIMLRQTGESEFTYAGLHNAPVVYRKNRKECATLEVDGIMLGFLDRKEFEGKTADRSFTLEKGDLLVLFTDGITDVKNNAGIAFGTEGIERAVTVCMEQAVNTAVSTGVIRDAIISEARKWGMPNDDMTVLVLERK